MGKSQPKSPDPYQTASAQTGSNISTAIANAMLGNVNQVTPYGSLSYDQTGTYSWTDPTTKSKYDIPTFTATQSLTPDGQAIQDSTIAAQKNLASTAETASGRLNSLMGSGVDLSKAPSAATAPTLQGGIAGAGQIQSTLGNSGAITNTYGTDFSADRQRVEDAIMSRAQSGLDSDRRALEQRLADQGIGIGSAAYQSAMDDYGRQVNDMRTSAILAGGQEQSRLTGLEADRAAFENSAQQQGFGQSLARGQFRNDAQAQQFSQNSQSAAFGNNAATQQYDLQKDARAQYLQEAYANRNQSLNEILGLQSGTQVQNPNFVSTSTPQMATTDIASLINGNYANQQSAWSDKMGGLSALLLSGLSLSDRDAKTDIEKVGKTDDGQNVYAYRYKHEGGDGPIHMGLMAQEVEKRKPDAVVKGADGLRRVHYGIALGV